MKIQKHTDNLIAAFIMLCRKHVVLKQCSSF